MRVLFTTHAASGHFHPLVPLARALQQAGHEVAFATAKDFGPTVEHNGFQHLPAGDVLGGPPGAMSDSAMAERLKQFSGMTPDMRLKVMARVFVGKYAALMVPELLQAASQWRPDVLVRGTMEFGAPVVARRLGVPCASIQVGANGPRDFLQEGEMVQQLNALRALVQLPPGAPEELLFDDLHLCFAPPSFLGKDSGTPTTHYLQSALFDQSGDERLPEWTQRLGQGRPVVYATMGTVVNKVQNPLRTLLEGLREEPVDLVMTVGRDKDPEAFGPQPPHIHVERYIPQTLLFPRCDLAILHGGYNSVTSALSHGLPLIVMPVGADQPMNAARCQELGVAQVLHPLEATPTQLRDAVREVLSNPSYREAARRYQQESASLPGLGEAVRLVEQVEVAP